MSESNTNEVFGGFQQHHSQPRTSTELQISQYIREFHPDAHVTCTLAEYFDFHGYANAKHAEYTVVEDVLDDRTSFYESNREYGKAGVLKDIDRFKQVRYKWEGKQYFIYVIRWDQPLSRSETRYFVVSLCGKEDVRKRYNPATDALLLAVGEWSSKLHRQIYVFDRGMWLKDSELWESVENSSWDDIILNSRMKDEILRGAQRFFSMREAYEKVGLPWKRGLIFHGEPGNGKTMAIKALVKSLTLQENPISALYVKTFKTKMFTPQNSIRIVFNKARDMAPCVLIFEDLDSFIDEDARSYFLNEIDGFSPNKGILIIASTNHLLKLDPALAKRPTRFDRKYHFGLPKEKDRNKFCRLWQSKVNLIEFSDELCIIIAALTDGFSFAYLKELFTAALLDVCIFLYYLSFNLLLFLHLLLLFIGKFINYSIT
jgi:transitional endoplasmic reticulum ATPase